MIRVLSNSGYGTEFSREQSESIPYMRDVYENIGADRELEAPFVSDQQLMVLKRILVSRPVSEDGTLASFVPRFAMVRLGDTLVRRPPFTEIYWDSYYDAVFKLLDEDQITDLIFVAQKMAAWDLRKGAMYLLLYKWLRFKLPFTRFFAEASAEMKRILKCEYNEALTNAKDSDYYVHQDSIHWD